MQHQAIRREQQHLKEHEQVKGVARQESAKNPHQLKLIERVKMLSLFVPPGRNHMDQNQQPKDSGQQHHQRSNRITHTISGAIKAGRMIGAIIQ